MRRREILLLLGGATIACPRAAVRAQQKAMPVIVAAGGPAAKAAKNATSTIPIVFSMGIDPVAEGFVTSLAHPGGNLTGLSILAAVLPAKRFELLCELVPSAKVIALLVNPNESSEWVPDVQTAARCKGVELPILRASNKDEIDTAFAALAGPARRRADRRRRGAIHGPA